MMRFKAFAAFAALIIAGTAMHTLATEPPFYDPSNPASKSGITTDYDLYRTIGCPGRGLLDAPCKIPDTDGDGVTDDKDKCPNTPKGRKVDATGCELDSDGDGVTDTGEWQSDTDPLSATSMLLLMRAQ
jgi:OOP family OmpA-OmpF porin